MVRHHCCRFYLILTLVSHSELLMFAFMAQCRCDPARTPLYFGLINKLLETMKARGVPASVRDELETFILEEKSKGRWTREDLKKGAQALGFGRDNALGVELDDEVDEEFILRAWRDCIKRSWRSLEGTAGSEKRAELNDALKMLAESRSSTKLMDAWKNEKSKGMSPDSAYSTLEVPKDVDDEMLLTVYSFRVSALLPCEDSMTHFK